MRSWGRLIWWAAVVVICLMATLVITYVLRADNSHQTVVQTVVAVIAFVASATVFLISRVRSTAPTPPPLPEIADQLADLVRAQWESTSRERRLENPITVWWRWSDHPVTGTPEMALRSPAGMPRFPPLHGTTAITEAQLKRGTIRDLFRIYAGLDSGRLVIVGTPGSGKSGAAVSLVIDALRHRAGLDDAARAKTPVPVLLTVHGWQTSQPVNDWLSSRLAQAMPYLATNGLAYQLIRAGCVSLVLDGLDEMPEQARKEAIGALNRATFRIVVLTRTTEMVETSTSGHLVGSAALELTPVQPGDAADFLANLQVRPLPPPWQRLIDRLRHRPEDPLSQALTSPLALTLVRDTFGRADDLDTDLLARDFATPDAAETELLRRVLPVAYRKEPGQSAPSYTESEATHYLRYLASLMNRNSVRDLAWWELPTWLPRTFRITMTATLAGLIGGLTAGLGTGFGAGLADGLGIGIGSGLGLAFVLGFVAERESRNTLQPRQISRLRSLTLGRALALTLAIGLALALAARVATGLAIGLAIVPLVVLAGLLAADLARPTTDTRQTDPRSLWRTDLQAWLVSGIGTALASGPAFALVAWLTLGHLDLGIGPTAWLAIGFSGGLVGGLGLQATDAAWWHSWLTFVRLSREGNGPRQMIAFLEDARARQVLRTAGPVYQFRHARLQDLLAERLPLTDSQETSLPTLR